jgi:hypothetical protein
MPRIKATLATGMLLSAPNVAARTTKAAPRHQQLLAEPNKCKAGQNSYKKDLEDIALAEGADKRVRNDVHQEWDKADLVRQLDIRLDYARVQFADVNVHADARLHDVYRHKPDYEGDGRHDFKIDDCLNRHAANTGHVRVKAAIDGRLPYGMGIARLTDLPAEWSKQREMLGFPPH